MAWQDFAELPVIGQIQPYSQPSNQPRPQKKKNFWVDQISTAGGILGGIGGSFVAPIAGTVGGAAAGSGLGEAIENILVGEDIGKNVAKEAILGGIFATPPIKAGKALLSARAGARAPIAASQALPGAAAAQTAKTGMQRKMSDLGNSLLTSQYGTIGKPVARATRPEETFGQLADYGLTKPDDVERVASSFTGANGLVSKAVSKAVGKSQRVPTDGIQQVFDDAVELNGLVDKDAAAVQSVFRAQMKKLMGGPSGSLRADANPNDVLEVMRALEKRAANLTGKGSNYRLSTPERVDQAKALLAVRDELEDRLFQAAGANNSLATVLTPQFREQLLKLQPGNTQWQQFVDDTVMQSGDIGALRSSMAPFVRARQIIDEADINSMTFGGRAGNATPGFAGALGGVVDPIAGAITGAAQTAVRSPVARVVASGLRGGANSVPANSVGRPSIPGITARVGAAGIGSGVVNQFNSDSGNSPNTLEDALLTSQPVLRDGPDDIQPSVYGREALLSDINRDPRNYDKYLDLYQAFNPERKADKLSATQQSQASRAQNALGDLQIVAGAINSGNIARTAIPGSKNAFVGNVLGTSDIEAALFNIGDVILRSRTGAQAPESEIRAFVSGFLPRAGESKESQMYKLQRAYRELQGMASPPSSLEDAVVAASM